MSTQNKFQIFRSSAGSGKTFTLVKEYFKIILDNPDRFKHTLAITFTNKSTAEMKGRILETAQDIALNQNNDIYNKVIEEKHELKARQKEAKKVLKNILHNYPQFSISTIDSFFSKVIRSLAYESGVPMQFQIELNNKQIIDKICAELYFDIGTDEPLKKWLLDFTNHKIKEEKGWNLDKNLKDAAKELFNDAFRTVQPLRNENETETVKKLNKIIAVYESAANKIGKSFESVYTKNNLDISDFYRTNTGPAKILLNWAAKNYTEPNSYVQKFYNGNTEWGRAKQANKDLVDSMAMEFNGMLDEAMQHHIRNSTDYNTAKEIRTNLYSTAVLNKLDEKYNGYKENNQVLTINDYMHSLSNLVGDDDTPFVYEKVGTRFHHLLIDEFQDTSATQWKNLKPLVENSLAEGKSSLVVGDAKQSIYRWRGSRMELLAGEIHDELAHWEKIIEDEPLDTNYRSTKEIVEFNNAFFHAAKEIVLEEKQTSFLPDDLETIKHVYDEETLKQIPHEKDGGYVELNILPKEYPANFNAEIQQEYSVFYNQAMQYTLQTINSLYAKGYKDEDICILVRKKDEIKMLTQFLLQNDISEIVSADSLFIDDASSVALLLNTLRHINNYDDQVAIANIIYHHNTLQNENYDWNALLKFKIVDSIPSDLEEEFLKVKSLPLLNACESICRLFELDTTNDQYILKFLDIVLAYSKRPESNLSDFLEWYESSDTQSLDNSENQNAIQIMTIHKSKGLQFPVLIVPFANWQYSGGAKVSTEWLKTEEKNFEDINFQSIRMVSNLEKTHFINDYKHEQSLNLIDNLNLLYVAFTRAENKLFIAGNDDSTRNLSNTSQLIKAVLDSEKIEIKKADNAEVYSIGTINNKIEKTKDDKPNINSFSNPEQITLENYQFLDWENTYSLSLKSLQEKEDFGKEEIRLGNTIHNKLSRVEYNDELHELIEQLKQKEEMQLPHFSELVDGLVEMEKNPETTRWFS
ncbi:MAG: UvrD-helicase domain-containing protein, partial [Bacteroidia bacterium]|nr:UvrD-helicase domain-containing protein [Bacteroidia bacterium]